MSQVDGELMREELWAIAGPLVADIAAHPFWEGLCDGTLPQDRLWHFAEQDARFAVPAYARALARTGAVADRDQDSALLCGAASATLAAVARMDGELSDLAREFGEPDLVSRTARVSPATHAHTSFMLAAPTASFAAGLGGLLPMTWFHQKLSLDLKQRCAPGSRYAEWIDRYCPESGFHDYVEAYLGMVDDYAARGSGADRSALVEAFRHGARHESNFAESAWLLQRWDV
ncbi:TenA family protein [Streptacidiphilus sp. PAMC 29251]